MKKTLSIFLLCLTAVTVMSKPAYRGAITRTMADGTEKTVYLHGNEFFHYMTDIEGQWLHAESLEPMSEMERNAYLDAGIAAQKIRRARTEENAIGGKPNIAPRGLLILVNFQDVRFKTPVDTIKNMLDGEHFTRSYNVKQGLKTVRITSSGSARQYFQDQSYGQYNPIFDIVGPVTISKEMAYYGENDKNGDDLHPDEMVQEACSLANSQCDVDFSIYDNDNDGEVDFVYIIYAGFGEADGGEANTVWPHKYQLSYTGKSIRLDGKTVNEYACGSELNFGSKQYDGVGTFCHEFSHVLGLPDFYTTNGASHHTLCDWDLMDAGSYNNDGNTPPAYSSYERFIMGWLTPRVLKDPQSVWLDPINFMNGDAVLLCEGDSHNLVGWNPNPKTFYLLEAHTKDGWDKHLPGDGMLITKIQYNKNKWAGNTVNNVASSMGVDILEAKKNTSDFGKATDAYPTGATEWTDFENHEVTLIAFENGGAITFSYRNAPKGIDDVTEGKTALKVLQEGRVVIIRNGVSYNLNGRVLDR